MFPMRQSSKFRIFVWAAVGVFSLIGGCSKSTRAILADGATMPDASVSGSGGVATGGVGGSAPDATDSGHIADGAGGASAVATGGVSGGGGSAGTTTAPMGIFAPAGNMVLARERHTATLLGNGKVFIAGGYGRPSGIGGEVGLSDTELYDPVSRTFTPAGTMTVTRAEHTATLLGNGKVLLAGGYSGPSSTGSFSSSSSAELYDPATGTFTAAKSMTTVRSGHTATLLNDGKVLLVGSYYTTTQGSDLYDPVTGIFSPTGRMTTTMRSGHTSTLLSSGKVLVVGGVDNDYLASAELYDPTTATFAVTGSLATPRAYHTATLLPNGNVLIAGGLETSKTTDASPHRGVFPPNAEIFDPQTGTFTLASYSPLVKRLQATATLLPNGMILIAAGQGEDTWPTSSDLYDPTTGTFSLTGGLSTGRYAHTATGLPSGQVLIAGGDNASLPLASAEIYE
jgi:hypothetical protein